MDIKINAVLAHCTLYCFQYSLQLVLELVFILLTFIGTLKKMMFVLCLILVLKQQFIELIKMGQVKEINIKNGGYY